MSIQGEIDRIEMLVDPRERALAAVKALEELGRIKDIRDLAINQLRFEHRESLRSIAKALGLSKTSIAEITG